ncbi:hypothetical protein H7200_02320 [Candidatus Saccharibacteria bacterium]|nr:hypothetical protein [Candidatus Saccharibacteria bacterium]
MAHKGIIKRLSVLVGLALCLLLAPSLPANAQSTERSDGLEISPALVEVSADRGKSYVITITVRNVTNMPLTFDSSVDDFGAKDETGAPSILLESDKDLPTSIKTWIKSIPSFRLEANEKTTLNVTIFVPNDAEPGGHYGVIRFAGRTPGTNDAVGQIASAGTLILIDVEGEASEKLELSSLQITKNNKAGSIFESGPLTFVSRFKNTGSVHLKPVGQIEIRDSFGNNVEVIKVNSDKGNVLPGSIRRFESPFNKSWMFGRYTADMTIAYGTTGQAVTNTISFWVIPYKIIAVALAVLLTLIYILINAVKRYNKHIITKSHKRK